MPTPFSVTRTTFAFAILIEADNTSGGRRLQDGVVNLLARGVEDPPSEAARR